MNKKQRLKQWLNSRPKITRAELIERTLSKIVSFSMVIIGILFLYTGANLLDYFGLEGAHMGTISVIWWLFGWTLILFGFILDTLLTQTRLIQKVKELEKKLEKKKLNMTELVYVLIAEQCSQY